MIRLLAHFFIKPNTPKAKQRGLYGVLCSVTGIILNIILFAAKLAAGLLSGSIAITADALNNLSDAGSSVITLVGFKLGEQKPDHEHPFGHGRVEYLSGFVVSLLILLMGFELLKSSVEKIITPEEVAGDWLTILILALSIAVKLYMFFYNRRIGKKIDSAAMLAAATDSVSDCIATAAVLVCTLIGSGTGLQLDGWCGAAVAIFILIAGIKTAKETISPLLGEAPTQEFVKNIEKIVMSYPSVVGIHDLIVHDYGPGRRMISLHAEVPASGDILNIHDEIDNAERQLAAELGCHAVIHMDPIETDNPECMRLQEQVKALVKSIDEQLSIHDFRMVTGPTHTNLIFDLVIPHHYKTDEKTLQSEVNAAVKQTMGEQYYSVIQTEQSYIE